MNAHHIVPKIRCVACALLDMTVDDLDPMVLGTSRLPESSKQEASVYLSKFLGLGAPTNAGVAEVFDVLNKIAAACTLPENPEI